MVVEEKIDQALIVMLELFEPTRTPTGPAPGGV
jgi:hypothetical protein